MLVKNQYDAVCLGSSYLSCLFSLQLQQRGKDVLIVDDRRMRYGEEWALHLGELEREFLRQWGESLQVEPLKQIEQYLRPGKIQLCVAGRRLILGGTPFENLREFIRKFPECFAHFEKLLLFKEEEIKSFNAHFLVYLNRVSEMSFKFKNEQDVDLSLFERGTCPEFDQVFTEFSKAYFQEGQTEKGLNVLQRNLVFVLQSIFLSKFSKETTDLELFYVLLSALSPRYYLDEIPLRKELFQCFTDRGGQYKKTSIMDWQIYKGRPINVLLESFEGVIHPQSVFVMGGQEHHIPFMFGSSWEYYVCLNLAIKAQSNVFAGYEGTHFVFSNPLRLGSERSLWKAQFISGSSCLVKIPCLQKKGLKLSLEAKTLAQDVLADLNVLFPGANLDLKDQTIRAFQGPDQWITKKSSLERWPRPLQKMNRRPFRLLENFGPAPGKTVTGVKYWGPLSGPELGLFSFFLELKSWV